MNQISIQHFCDRVAKAGHVSADDVRELSTVIVPDGFLVRDDADLLLALDRTVSSDESFADFLVAAVVDFAVWGERPTGTIDRDTASWLAASIAGRSGPTKTGARIAMEIVREAHNSDEALIAFALQANRWTRDPATGSAPRYALAA